MEKIYRLDDGRSASVMLTDDGCAIVSLDLFDEVIEIINNNYKYRWHDLRKNPEDLPTNNKVFIVMKPKDEYIGYWSKYEEGTGYYNKEYNAWIWSCRTTWIGENDITKDEIYTWLEVIAWRELEPFEEVEQRKKLMQS